MIVGLSMTPTHERGSYTEKCGEMREIAIVRKYSGKHENCGPHNPPPPVPPLWRLIEGPRLAPTLRLAQHPFPPVPGPLPTLRLEKGPGVPCVSLTVGTQNSRPGSMGTKRKQGSWCGSPPLELNGAQSQPSPSLSPHNHDRASGSATNLSLLPPGGWVTFDFNLHFPFEILKRPSFFPLRFQRRLLFLTLGQPLGDGGGGGPKSPKTSQSL